MRIVFCGTPEFAVPTLRELLAHRDFSVEAVVTQPDRPRGRGQTVSSSPVKEVGLGAGLHVYQPETTKSDSAYDFFKRVSPDAVVIIAYGQIVPARLIALAPLGWINLHASLLPRYRGAAPIAWAIANGEHQTGLTTMQIDAGMDTGPILLQEKTDIGGNETAPELAPRMAKAGAPLVIESLAKLGRGEISGHPQDSTLATYAPRLEKKHGRIDWSQSARQIYDRIRGFAPWPGAYTTFRGQLCHLWGHPAEPGAAVVASGATPGLLFASSGGLRVVCGESSALDLSEVRLEGRKRITAIEFANGAHLVTGERFGD